MILEEITMYIIKINLYFKKQTNKKPLLNK